MEFPTEAEMQARVLYRDALVLVLDKPAGIPVHPGSGGGITMEDYFDAFRFGLPTRPALAHRLDRDTSGCLVLGRHKQALKQLGQLFAQNKIEKTYFAVVHGEPPEAEGIIDMPLARESAAKHRWRMKADANGQTAITRYRLLASVGGQSWLALTPETGRTHQLRVHCAHIGCPILGDRHYGKLEEGLPMQLHAQSIRLPLYPKREAINIEAPLPAHFLPLPLGDIQS